MKQLEKEVKFTLMSKERGLLTIGTIKYSRSCYEPNY